MWRKENRETSAEKNTLWNTGTNGKPNPFIASGSHEESISDHIDGKQMFSISSTYSPRWF